MRLRRGWATLPAALAILLATPLPGRAAGPTGTIRLVSQTGWVPLGGDFTLRLAATTKTPDDLEIAVTVYPAVATRSDFNESLLNRVRGSAVSVMSQPLSDLTPDQSGAVAITLRIQDPGQPRDPGRIRLRGAGVYPVAVELRGVGGGNRVDHFTTHLVNLPDAVSGPKLATAVVLPIAAPPALQKDGSRRVTAAWSSATRAIVDATQAYADVPVTLVPQPETLQALAASGRPEDRETVAGVGRLAETHQILAAPYVRLAEPAYAGGFESEETAQRRRGAEVVTQLLGVAPTAATVVVDDGLDDAAANRLLNAQVQRAVVRERALAPITRRTTLTQPFQLRGRNGRRLSAAVADDGLAAHFDDDRPASLAAHQLLADLAVLYFDSPGLVRGAIVLPPPGWHASAEFLAPLLDGLRNNPVLGTVDASGLFAGVPAAGGATRGSILQRDAAPSTSSASNALPATELRRARRELAGLTTLTTADNPAIVALDERVLAAQSADLRSRDRTDAATAAEKAIRAQLNGIRVPPNQSITLTARRGEIPVTVLRDVPYAVRVVVQLTSDKLQFPTGSSAMLDLSRRNTTARFTVQARGSGTFPLEVTLRSPDGRLVLSSGRFTIRSRAASGVGVILSVSALCFLIVWWGRHIVTVRRTRR